MDLAAVFCVFSHKYFWLQDKPKKKKKKRKLASTVILSKKRYNFNIIDLAQHELDFYICQDLE